jgi:hypothetical protein
MFGKMEIDYFTPGKCKVRFPENKIHTDNQDYGCPKSEEIAKYEIIYRDEKTVVIVYNDPTFGKTVQTLNFTDCNVMVNKKRTQN